LALKTLVQDGYDELAWKDRALLLLACRNLKEGAD